MLRLKFPVTMATRGYLKIAKNHYFALIFSIKIDFTVLQLLNQMLFSVGYTLPYDQSGLIYSLSQVQNFPGDEGDSAPFKPPKQKAAHPPSGNPLVYLLVRGPRRKRGHFFNNISQTITSVGA
jgi:hypothetical protein